MAEWHPIILSIKVASLSLCFVSISGVAAAYITRYFIFPGKSIIEALCTLPLVFPPIVTGFILLILFGKHGPAGKLLAKLFDFQIIFTPYAAVLVGTVVAFPLMYQSTKAAFQRVDKRLEDAARTLGASEWKVFLTVTLPLSWHGLLAGAVLSFARSLGEFGATMMVAGNIPGKTQTIPLAIYFAAEANDLSEAGFYSAIMSIIIFFLIYGLNRWSAASGGVSWKEMG